MDDQLLDELIERARSLEKYAVSRLITVFEDRRPAAAQLRHRVLETLDRVRGTDAASPIVGMTGTPGSGKSSLLSRITVDVLRAEQDLSLAVIAVDPSSHVSGGALLGDRTRMRFAADERRLFFRSQASATDLGGLGPMTFQVTRLLARLFDCVLIETVGIGQSEADIRHLADRVYLVLQPLGGDEVQFLKAGIIEVPHAFIINKSDESGASTSFHQLRSSLWLSRPFDDEEPPVFLTSARTGAGLDELESDIVATIRALAPGATGSGTESLRDREPYFFMRWVEEEWGRVGLAHLDGPLGGAAAYLDTVGGFDPAQSEFGPALTAALA